MKNVLVTGGTGFIGSHLIEELLNHTHNIVTMYQTEQPYSYFWTSGLHKKVTMTRESVDNFDALLHVITKFDIDHVFHLAAQPLVDVAYYHPRQTLFANIVGTINVLECARQYSRIKGVVVASSDKAYGKTEKESYDETDPLRGDHPYEVSKSAADLISTMYYKTYGIPVVVARFGNVYGEGDLNFSRIVPGVMQSMITDARLDIRSNGKFVRDYIYVKDVAKGYILLAKNITAVKGEAYNFGSSKPLSVLGVLKTAEKSLKKKVPYKILNIAKNEIPHQSLNYEKIKKAVGWEPTVEMADVFPHIQKWYYRYFLQSLGA